MGPRTTALAAALTVGAAVLAGCGSSGGSGANGSASKSASSAGSSAAASSSAASSASTPGGSPSASASASVSPEAQQFVALTTTIDTDLAAFVAQPDSTPVPQVQQAAAKIAADESALATTLPQHPWSPPVATAVDALVQTLGPEVAVWQQATTAPSIAAIKQVLTGNQSVIAARSAASAHVRAALGLPNPTPSGGAAGTASPTGSATA